MRNPSSRRGAVTLIATFAIVVGVLLTALVIDWAYLVNANRGMEDVSTIMALAAAPELLDQNLLLDANGPPTPNQASARTEALVTADQYRQLNNAVLPTLQQVNAGDVTVLTGFVNDVSLCPPLLDPTPQEYNTVFVAVTRTTTGSHPMVYPVGLTGGTAAAEIRGGAYATLDNLVVGFQPEAEMSSPLMPLGILTTSWTTERTVDSNGDGILEMTVRLQSANPPANGVYPAAPNGALLFYDGTFSAQELSQTLPTELAQGVFPANFSNSASLGPATPNVTAAVLGSQWGDASDAGAQAILAAIQPIIGQKRVFPLIQSVGTPNADGSATVQIEGFAACTILSAATVDNRLTVTVEPCFLIHHTAWTVAPSNPSAPAGLTRNLYIYKLRVSR